MSPIKHSSHARYEIWYHFAWGTKYRKRVFVESYIKDKVKIIFYTIAAHYDLTIGVVECLSDHVHLTVSAPPRIAPARIAQILKSVSTKELFEQFSWLRKHYWGGEIWTGGYFVRSIGPGLTKEKIEQYVQAQAEEI